MRTTVQIESEDTETLQNILSPSLDSRGKVDVKTTVQEHSLNIEIKTNGLGPLRGTTDNVFRLASLAKKITEQ